MGCLLAMIKSRLHANDRYFRFTRSWWPSFIPLLIWLASLKAYPLFSETIGVSIVFVRAAIGIDILILRHESPIGTVANNRFVILLGRWSYSLYLWQQIFLAQTPGAQPYAWFPLNLVLSILCAAGSFYLIEQPAIAWGRRASAGLRIDEKNCRPEPVYC